MFNIFCKETSTEILESVLNIHNYNYVHNYIYLFHCSIYRLVSLVGNKDFGLKNHST